jgi:hypothetical protein
MVLQDGVGVEVLGGVEPEPELLLPAADAIGEDVGVQSVRLASDVAEELKVDLIVVLPRHIFRHQLQLEHANVRSEGGEW